MLQQAVTATRRLMIIMTNSSLIRSSTNCFGSSRKISMNKVNLVSLQLAHIRVVPCPFKVQITRIGSGSFAPIIASSFLLRMFSTVRVLHARSPKSISNEPDRSYRSKRLLARNHPKLYNQPVNVRTAKPCLNCYNYRSPSTIDTNSKPDYWYNSLRHPLQQKTRNH